jgi:hypothetical protein
MIYPRFESARREAPAGNIKRSHHVPELVGHQIGEKILGIIWFFQTAPMS